MLRLPAGPVNDQLERNTASTVITSRTCIIHVIVMVGCFYIYNDLCVCFWLQREKQGTVPRSWRLFLLSAPSRLTRCWLDEWRGSKDTVTPATWTLRYSGQDVLYIILWDWFLTLHTAVHLYTLSKLKKLETCIAFELKNCLCEQYIFVKVIMQCSPCTAFFIVINSQASFTHSHKK